MRVIAFDPGLSITGYACIDATQPSRPALLEAGHVSLAHPRTARDADATPAAGWGPRLVELGRDVADVLERLRPSVAAVEAVFAHRAHPRAAVAMAHARGVILERLTLAGLDTVELAPAAVKKALTGSGRASKDQVAAAAAQALRLAAAPTVRDVSDAMAIALAAVRRVR
jgi:crossover junction endodeoxyribonuclease RuvC